ncbi:MAG: hypothetical protein JHC95_07715 [Solirubrobacteraceae bacterium]|nr:hypothetical protein [Solirubrobacteraceae bacterium]
MDELCVQRRLVKSPPELWAEVSDAEALSRHLDLFGEIRIARLEPETTVAWEGDRASGTVVLDAEGWGTKVTLTAEIAPIEAPEADGSAQSAPPQEEEAGDTTPVAAIEPAGGPAATPPADVVVRAEPPAPVARKGLMARLFRRWGAGLEPHRGPQPELVALAAPIPEAIAPEPVLVAAPVEPLPEPEPSIDPAQVTTALEGVLDTLGAAHHRPFSR